MKLLLVCVLALILAPASTAVPPLVRVPSPFAEECPEYMCSFTVWGEEDCYSPGDTIYAGPLCTAVCDFGVWRLDCE